MSYTNALITLFVVIFALGFYATCRVSMRAVLREYRFFRPEGTFEIMEHLLPLALLAVYWPFGAGFPSGPAALTYVRPAEPSDRHIIDEDLIAFGTTTRARLWQRKDRYDGGACAGGGCGVGTSRTL
jgi:hypothetical protein